MAAVPACGGSDPTCGGAISLTCSQLTPDWCAAARGCQAVPGRCATTCEWQPTEGACANGCKWDGTKCESPCLSATDEAKCKSYVSSIGEGAPKVSECAWGGPTCTSPCPTFDTPEACQAQSLARCTWIACEGKPKGPCSSYSGDNCPVFLGCDKSNHPVISTQ